MADATLWGCLECGTLSETLTADQRCPACHDGLVTALGGEPTAEKAQALLAWARRDATAQLEWRGMVLGGVAGLALAVLLSLALDAGGLSLLVVLVWAAVLGGVAGHLSSFDLHRRLRPHSRLQPVIDAAARQRARRLLVVLLAVGAVLVSLVAGGGADAHAVRRVIARVWGWMA